MALDPESASDEELQGLESIRVDLPARGWEGEVRKIPAILILPYYRRWWLRWRRTFIIRGRVQCLALKGSLAEIDPNLPEPALHGRGLHRHRAGLRRTHQRNRRQRRRSRRASGIHAPGRG